jgi:hypothetical protein
MDGSPLLSRVQHRGSLGRHFSQWRFRTFTIDIEGGSLVVRDGLELTAIPLVALSSQLQPYYTKGRACLRLIVCTANAEEITEFLLVFCSQEQLELWRTVFDEAKAAYS